MKQYQGPTFLVMLLGLVSTVGEAEPLWFSFQDPVGDNDAIAPDVRELTFFFDNSTGEYQINVTADAAAPFAPTAPAFLSVRVNLFNPDVGTNAQDPSFFRRFTNSQLSAPTTALTFIGTEPRLTSWKRGDRVAIDSSLGNPIGIGFFSSAAQVAPDRIISGEDRIAAGGVATIQSVPEPSSAILLTTAVAASLALLRRERTRLL